MLIYVFAIPLVFHGLANLAGVFAPWTKTLGGFANASLIFSSSLLYQSWAGKAFGLFWLASTACLVSAGAGLFLHRSWWLPLAIAGCAFSAIAIFPWWKAVPAGARFGGIFDLVMIVLLVSPLVRKIL